MPKGIYARTEETRKRMSLAVRKPITWIVNENGCHICTSHIKNNGWHPMIKRNGKLETINRYIYRKEKGEIPKGMFVCHTCDEPTCINPKHLFLGTIQDNNKDMILKNRQAKGEKQGQHKLTEQQILEIFNSKEKQQKLAKKYNITQAGVSLIKSGKTWQWLTEGGRKV